MFLCTEKSNISLFKCTSQKKKSTHREKRVGLKKQNVFPSANIFQGFRTNIFLIYLWLLRCWKIVHEEMYNILILFWENTHHLYQVIDSTRVISNKWERLPYWLSRSSFSKILCLFPCISRTLVSYNYCTFSFLSVFQMMLTFQWSLNNFLPDSLNCIFSHEQNLFKSCLSFFLQPLLHVICIRLLLYIL